MSMTDFLAPARPGSAQTPVAPGAARHRSGPGRIFRATRLALAGAMIVTLGACEDGEGLAFLQPRDTGTTVAGGGATGAGRSTQLVERDVEAPEVFQITEAGLWDGRPSLGGVWVAHPDVKDPERVIIRNPSNDTFVIEALFRKERETPGPRLQVSSDAASALSMLAGSPTNLNVIALRRETVEPAPGTEDLPTIDAPPEIEAQPLDDLETMAGAAIDAGRPGADVITPAAAPAAAPANVPTAAPAAPARAASALDKPFIQIGIFSVEQNANNTATAMRQAGMVPTVREQSSAGKAFWRVLVGPADTSSERAALLRKIKASGFTDAYAVSN